MNDSAKDTTPIFGEQASWICYKENRQEEIMPNEADIAFLFLKTFRTKAEKHQEKLISSGMKKEVAIKEARKIEDADRLLTRLQCPYLNYDEEGDFDGIYFTFLSKCRQKAVEITSKSFSENDACTTNAWNGEHRSVVLNI